MCKRILNIRDNKLYTFSEIGLRLNDYFIKHNLEVRNKHYELHKFGDLCKAEGLEPGKHKGFELYPIAQKEIDRVKANQPGKKPVKVKKTAPGITPIEELAESTAKEFKKAEAAKAVVEEPKAPAEPEAKTEPVGDPVEVIRKKFYTDYHFFIKYAQTPEERTAITKALGNLYGSIGELNKGGEGV